MGTGDGSTTLGATSYSLFLDLLAESTNDFASFREQSGQRSQARARYRELYRQAFQEIPCDIFNEIETLKVVHAVQKPLSAPGFARGVLATEEPTNASGNSAGTSEAENARLVRMVRFDGSPEEWRARMNAAPQVADYENGEAVRRAWYMGKNPQIRIDVSENAAAATFGRSRRRGQFHRR